MVVLIPGVYLSLRNGFLFRRGGCIQLYGKKITQIVFERYILMILMSTISIMRALYRIWSEIGIPIRPLEGPACFLGAQGLKI